MIRKLFILPFLLSWSFTFSQSSSVEQIRQLFSDNLPGEAIEKLDAKIQSIPQDEQAIYWLMRAEAYIFVAKQEIEGYEDPYIEAGISLQEAINNSETQPEITVKAIQMRDSLYQHLITAGKNQADPEAALLNVSYAQFVSPDDTLAYLHAAVLAEKLDHWQIALFNYERVLPLGIQSPEPVLNLVNLTLSQSRDTLKALKLASQGFKQVHYSDSLHRLLNRLLILTDQSEAAKKQIRRSIYETPEEFDNYFNMAMLLVAEGRGEEANSYYLTATQRDSNDVRAWKNWADYYLEEAKRMSRDYYLLPVETPADIKSELQAAYTTYFQYAAPLMEKVNALEPNSLPILKKLDSIYTGLDMRSKQRQIGKQIQELEAG